MGSFFSAPNETSTAKHVFASYMVPADDNAGDDAHHRRAYDVQIARKKTRVFKPQWPESRPFFAADSIKGEYGSLTAYHRDFVRDDQGKHVPAHMKANLLYGPPLRRWVASTNIQEAKFPKCIHSMSMSLCPSGADRSVMLKPEMVWPVVRSTVLVSDTKNLVVWNGDYCNGNHPYAGKPVLQHGSVLLEETDNAPDAAADKIAGVKKYPLLASKCVLVSPKKFLEAMQGDRWIVLVGGYHPSDKGNKSAFEDVAYSVGAALGNAWDNLKTFFSGILTQSGAGFCDTVSWEEEISRGFCESHGGSTVPIYHVKDSNLVSVEGNVVEIPFGHSAILDYTETGAWQSDFDGLNRDAALALLAQDGLVLYGGLSTADLTAAVATFSLSPPRPPLMSVVVGGAFHDSKINMPEALDALKNDVAVDAVRFGGITKSRAKTSAFFFGASHNENLLEKRKEEASSFMNRRRNEDSRRRNGDSRNFAADDEDFFFRGNVEAPTEYDSEYGYDQYDQYDQYGSRYRDGETTQIAETVARLPIVYLRDGSRKRATITGITETRREKGAETNTATYTTNLVTDILNRVRKRTDKERSTEDNNMMNYY